MRRVETHNTQVLEFKRATGLIGALFGIGFGAVAVYHISGVFPGALIAKNGVPLNAWLRFLSGLVFGVVGLVCLGQEGLVLDRSKRTVETWIGMWMFRWFRTERSLANFGRVTLSHVVRTGKGAGIIYYARLEGPSAPLDMWSSRDECQIRQIAKQIARFLDVPLRDAISCTEITLQPNQITECVRLKAWDAVRSSSNVAAFEVKIPPQPLPLLFLIPAVLIVAAIVGIAAALIVKIFSGSDSLTVWAIASTGALLILMPLILALNQTQSNVRIRDQMLEVETANRLSSRIDRLPLNNIEEFVIEPGIVEGRIQIHLAVISSAKILRFGGGLPVSQLDSLRSILEKVVTAQV